MPAMTDADRAFREPWWARLHAAQGKPQYVRVYREFIAACHEREAAIRQAADESKAIRRRADHAAAMRRFRALKAGRQ